MPPTPPILLLKTKSSPHDGYDDYFSRNGYTPTFIPVLEHRFHRQNLAHVRDLFVSGAFAADSEDADGESGITAPENNKGKKYGGMIFTSQRAVEGFARMIEEDGLPINPTPQIPLYTVGPATAATLTVLRNTHLPRARIHGAESGNGENLAHLILQHYNTLHPRPQPRSSPEDAGPTRESKSKPGLLFLVGEQRRDIIPTTLMDPDLPGEDRVSVDEVVVYETGEMGSFERDFGGEVRRFTDGNGNEGVDGHGDGDVLWVVVFSPSGCEGMLRVLGLGPFANDRDSSGDRDGDGKGRERRVLVATIGPTTRDYLREKFGFEADVCAERPSPEGVGDGIRRFMQGRGL